MIKVAILGLFLLLYADEDIQILDKNSFMTTYEYGQMLYNNPRGVSCAKCHGKDGEGGFISYYFDKNGKRINLIAPKIKNLSFNMMKKRLKKKKTSIMPNYELADKEIKAIVIYLRGREKVKDENDTE